MQRRGWRVHEWRKIYHGTTNQNKAMVDISFTNWADFNVRKVIRDKEGHYIIIEGSIVQEDTTTLNVYKLHYRVSNYVRQNLRELKREWVNILS